MRRLLRFVTGLALFPLGASAFAVSCKTQSQMTAAQRDALEQAALQLAIAVQAGNASAVRAQTIAPVAAQFSGIADSIATVQPAIDRATLTADSLYLLDASDLSAAQETQFFCGVPQSSLIVELTIPGLPPGVYALSILHATGVPHPQQLSMMLANEPAGSATWKLAGFFTRPMMMGGHDGVWFWREARAYTAKKQLWNAWFYYQTALYLLDPVDFLSSPNLQKLQREAEQARPGGLPAENPMLLPGDGQTYEILDLHTGDLAGQLDLVVHYKGTPAADPVAARAQVTAVMRALLRQHPELAAAFHGLWVYQVTPEGKQPFALELPISQIQSSGSAGGPGDGMANHQGKTG